jgi:hypothetical protein
MAIAWSVRKCEKMWFCRPAGAICVLTPDPGLRCACPGLFSCAPPARVSPLPPVPEGPGKPVGCPGGAKENSRGQAQRSPRLGEAPKRAPAGRQKDRIVCFTPSKPRDEERPSYHPCKGGIAMSPSQGSILVDAYPGLALRATAMSPLSGPMSPASELMSPLSGLVSPASGLSRQPQGALDVAEGIMRVYAISGK